MFKNGDFVLLRAYYASPTGIPLYNMSAVVVHDCVGNQHIGISFMNPIGGHDCQGRCKNGHGFYVKTSEIEKMVPLSQLIKQHAKRNLLFYNKKILPTKELIDIIDIEV